MQRIEVGGLVYEFEDDLSLMSLLDENADRVYEGMVAGKAVRESGGGYMMDYKELVERLRYTTCSGCMAGTMRDAATAIETLLAERDAAVEDLRFVADCTSCKYYPFDDSCEACLECSCENENVAWEWRGQQKGDAT